MMKTAKPSIEKISPGFGSSLFVGQFHETCRNRNPTWHMHPEMELVYVNGGSGRRHIGNHLSYFNNGDLIMIGSNLPHYGFTDRLTGNKSETVVQMKKDFLGESFFLIPEMSVVLNLFERAQMGISFHGKTKLNVGKRIKELSQYDAYDRLIHLLVILKKLAHSEEYTILNSSGVLLEIESRESDRINVVYDYVRDHFREHIALEEVADLASMTVPAFCRYFKKISGKTFTRFVNEYRLVHVTKLLSEQTQNITDICYESGFNNFSHFTKLFKEFTGKSPSIYRRELKQIVK